MKWRVVFPPEVEGDVTDAAEWYDSKPEGLGRQFREEVIQLFDELALNPLLGCRRHPTKTSVGATLNDFLTV